MDLESRQMELLEQFCLLAKNARGRAAAELVNQATSEPGLFAFGELLDLPQITELQGTEHAGAVDLLRLFAHGTWSDYKANSIRFPQLQPAQVLKLKQLTVMTLAETTKVLPYDLLMQQLDISNVRELEDLLINDCMYAGIVRGKLDQRRRCVEVHFAAGRDLRPGQLEGMLHLLSSWLTTSETLLQTIDEKIKWADTMSAQHRQHKKEVDEKAEEMKKNLKAESELARPELSYGDGGAAAMDYVEEDRSRPKRESKNTKSFLRKNARRDS